MTPQATFQSTSTSKRPFHSSRLGFLKVSYSCEYTVLCTHLLQLPMFLMLRPNVMPTNFWMSQCSLNRYTSPRMKFMQCMVCSRRISIAWYVHRAVPYSVLCELFIGCCP